MGLTRPELRRFIPVHTGNIQVLILDLLNGAVYPCAYREHSGSNSRSPKWCGLSLCIQGTLISNGISSLFLRFIPVHTGNISDTH